MDCFTVSSGLIKWSEVITLLPQRLMPPSAMSLPAEPSGAQISNLPAAARMNSLTFGSNLPARG
jgi:hypothetical protein